MTDDQLSRQKRIAQWVQGWITREQRRGPAAIEPLAGDGSLRCYYRIRLPETTFVLLADPQWTSSKDYAPHQAYLTSRHLPVPRFLATDPEAGFGVMEDLGDELLQDRLKAIGNDPAKKNRWLQSAVALLAQLHGETFPVPRDLPVSTRRFDRTKYLEELQFTLEHLHRRFLQMGEPGAAQVAALEQFCDAIAAIGPEVFCHRDYHTRNLLVFGERLYMIDFQDARLGSPHYDLASLLYDAYVPIAEAERTALWGYYKESLRGYPLHDAIDWSRFEHHLKSVAFQRVVKAAGSFASFFTRYGRKAHLPYLLPALRSAQKLRDACFPAGDPLRNAFDLEGWIAKASELQTQGDWS